MRLIILKALTWVRFSVLRLRVFVQISRFHNKYSREGPFFIYLFIYLYYLNIFKSIDFNYLQRFHSNSLYATTKFSSPLLMALRPPLNLF